MVVLLTSPVSTAERLASLKALHDTEWVSSSNTPTPFWVLLMLYQKADTACYIDHLAGFKALVSWLAPIEYTPREPLIIPPTFRSYEIQEIAHWCNCPQEQVYTTMIYDVLPRLEPGIY